MRALQSCRARGGEDEEGREPGWYGGEQETQVYREGAGTGSGLCIGVDVGVVCLGMVLRRVVLCVVA